MPETMPMRRAQFGVAARWALVTASVSMAMLKPWRTLVEMNSLGVHQVKIVCHQPAARR